MDWLAIAQAAATAISENEAKRSQNAWMKDVIAKLDQINGKLDFLIDEVREIKEQIARLPSKFDEILKDVEEARTLGARHAVGELLATSNLTELSPDMLEVLAEYTVVLSSHESMLENRWGYSSWWPVFTSFLTRAAAYRLLGAYNKAWLFQWKVALNRKIEFFDAGLSVSEGAEGPGRGLMVRLAERGLIEGAITPCLGTTLQICWYKANIQTPGQADGNNFEWLVWTQPYVSGGLAEGRVWMDPGPELQPGLQTVEDIKPALVGRIYTPVGSPELILNQGHYSIDKIYDQRRIIEADMNAKLNRLNLVDDTISHLRPIVEGMIKAREILGRMQTD